VGLGVGRWVCGRHLRVQHGAPPSVMVLPRLAVLPQQSLGVQSGDLVFQVIWEYGVPPHLGVFHFRSTATQHLADERGKDFPLADWLMCTALVIQCICFYVVIFCLTHGKVSSPVCFVRFWRHLAMCRWGPSRSHNRYWAQATVEPVHRVAYTHTCFCCCRPVPASKLMSGFAIHSSPAVLSRAGTSGTGGTPM